MVGLFSSFNREPPVSRIQNLLRQPTALGFIAGAIISIVAISVVAYPVQPQHEWFSLTFTAFDSPTEGAPFNPNISRYMEIDAAPNSRELHVTWFTEAGGVIRNATFVPATEAGQ